MSSTMGFSFAGGWRVLLGGALVALSLVSSAQVQVTTYHNDTLRTGLNAKETILTPSNVSSGKFGLLFSLPVDGQVYAQPLYLSGVSVPSKGVHNVVYVATEHNSLYAYDADSNTGANAQPLWHDNFGSSVPNGDIGSDDITDEIGITGTPVISLQNPRNPVIYLVAKTKSFDNGGNAVYTQKLHAISALSGAEMPGAPIVIGGAVPGTGEGSVGGVLTFDPRIQHCRAGLLFLPAPTKAAKNAPVDNMLYVAFASHGDNGPYHGWLFAYDVDKMQLVKIIVTTPNALNDPSGYPIAAGGVWQGGAGPASDGSNIYFATGNGWFDPSTGAFGDSILRINASSLAVADYFAPSNQLNLDDYDADLGSGGVMLLPASASGNSRSSYLVQSGKEGTIYLLDTLNLGKFHAVDQIPQELPYTMGGIFGAPAYFNNNVFFGPCYSSIVSFPIANGRFTRTTPSAYTSTGYQFPGASPSVSANGITNGILWAVQADAYNSGGPALLHAYDANNIATELYNSGVTQGRDIFGGAVKFVTPTIANGKVYAGSANSVGVFGLGTWAPSPTITPDSGNYVNSVQVTALDANPAAQIYYTTDGSIPTTASNLYTGPVTLTTTTILKARAFLNGSGASGVVEKDYLINAVIGSGSGLYGAYYDGVQDPGGNVTSGEVDPVINFNWNGSSPISGVGGSNWAAEWSGQIQAETTGAYTLTAVADDGVRVYINGQLVIDGYVYQGATAYSANLTFVAGQKYDIDIKFFQGGGAASLQLFWQSQGIPYQIVPKSQLYPGAAAPSVSPASGGYPNAILATASESTPDASLTYTLDGSTPTASSTPYTGPITISSPLSLKVRAFVNGIGGAVTQRDYLINPVIGTGDGLWGSYFNGLQDPSGPPTASQVDPQINFNWSGSPIAGVGASNFAGEWTGRIQAESSGPYTFTTNSDDGVRVYIDGNLVIDNYTYHAPTLNSGTINLVAGQKYNIDVKFFQGGGGAVLQLFWQAPALPYQLVPTSQLYSGH